MHINVATRAICCFGHRLVEAQVQVAGSARDVDVAAREGEAGLGIVIEFEVWPQRCPAGRGVARLAIQVATKRAMWIIALRLRLAYRCHADGQEGQQAYGEEGSS